MMAGSLIALFAQPGPWVKIIFSGGAAGILVAAVGFELFPILTEGSADWWAGPLGVLLGAGIFIVLGLVLPDLEDEDEEDEEEDSDTAHGADSPTGSKSNPVFGVSEKTHLLTDSSGDAEEGRATPSMNTVEKTQDPPTFVDTMAKSSKPKSLTLPWVRLAAVCLDGAVDGMLLGIVSSVGDKEAMLIAVGMTIEMCFVGVTLSTTLQKYPQPTWLKVLIVVVTPLAMYLGLVVGAYALYQVDQTTNEFVAVIGFGVSALLYLAVIELIPEIFEIGEDAGIQGSKISSVATAVVFVGFAIILILEGALSEADASA
jgi:ZIP family zinc transporter